MLIAFALVRCLKVFLNEALLLSGEPWHLPPPSVCQMTVAPAISMAAIKNIGLMLATFMVTFVPLWLDRV